MIPAAAAAEGQLPKAPASDPSGRLELRADGERIALYTSAALVQSNQRKVRASGLLSLGIGVALLPFSLWPATLVVAGLVLLFFVPGRLRQAKLLEVDSRARRLVITQEALGAGGMVAFDEVESIRGEFDTKGWDGFSLVNAVLRDGRNVRLAMLMGTDERLAEALCRTLGELLGRPASYAGPTGSVVAWAAPPKSP